MLALIFVRKIQKSCLFGIALVTLVGIFSDAAFAQAGYRPPLFGSKETPSPQLSLFPKWKGMLTRYFSERNLANEPCESSFFSRCHLQEWTAFLKEISGKTRLQ
jgi:hypothetical protein